MFLRRLAAVQRSELQEQHAADATGTFLSLSSENKKNHFSPLTSSDLVSLTVKALVLQVLCPSLNVLHGLFFCSLLSGTLGGGRDTANACGAAASFPPQWLPVPT